MREKFEAIERTFWATTGHEATSHDQETLRRGLQAAYRTGLEDAAKIAADHEEWPYAGYAGLVVAKEVAEAILKEAKEQP